MAKEKASAPMTEAMYYLMLALRSPAHGYKLMRDVERISHGRVRVGAGTLYGILPRLLDFGYILTTETDGKKVYSLTLRGEQALRAEYSRLQAMVLDGVAIKEATAIER